MKKDVFRTMRKWCSSSRLPISAQRLRLPGTALLGILGINACNKNQLLRGKPPAIFLVVGVEVAFSAHAVAPWIATQAFCHGARMHGRHYDWAAKVPAKYGPTPKDSLRILRRPTRLSICPTKEAAIVIYLPRPQDLQTCW